MNKENCVLKLVGEIILYYDARLKKHQSNSIRFSGSLLPKKLSPHQDYLPCD